MPLKLLIFGWIFGTPFLLISIWISAFNAIVAWKLYVRKVWAPSWIPLAGGICGFIALLVIPVEGLDRFCGLPLLLDYGSLPGFFHTIIFYVIYYSRRRN
jgi:hypothetical protein